MLQTGYNKIFNWLSSNFLKLNHNKTEILLIGYPSLTETLISHTPTLQFGPPTSPIKSSIKNLDKLLIMHSLLKSTLARSAKLPFFNYVDSLSEPCE